MDKLELFFDLIKNNDLYNLVIASYHDDYEIEYDDDDIKNSKIYKNIRLFLEDRINNGLKTDDIDFLIWFASGDDYNGYTFFKKKSIECWLGFDFKTHYINIMQIEIHYDEEKRESSYFDIDEEFENIKLSFDVSKIKEDTQQEILEALRETLAKFGVSKSSYKRY